MIISDTLGAAGKTLALMDTHVSQFEVLNMWGFPVDKFPGTGDIVLPLSSLLPTFTPGVTPHSLYPLLPGFLACGKIPQAWLPSAVLLNPQEKSIFSIPNCTVQTAPSLQLAIYLPLSPPLVDSIGSE